MTIDISVNKRTLQALQAALQAKAEAKLDHVAVFRDGTLAATDRFSLVVATPLDNGDSDLAYSERPVALIAKSEFAKMVKAAPAGTHRSITFTIDTDTGGIAVKFKFMTDIACARITDDYPPVLRLLRSPSKKSTGNEAKINVGLSPATMNTAMKVAKAMEGNFFVDNRPSRNTYLNEYESLTHKVELLTVAVV